MKQNTGRKLLSVLLALVMVVGLMPGMGLTALAYDSNPYSGLVNTTTTVKFNDVDWYVIADNSTAVDAGTLTLFAKEPIGTSAYNDAPFFQSNYSNSIILKALKALTATGGTYANARSAIKTVYLKDNDIESVQASGGYGVKLYLLSATEMNSLSDEIKKCSDNWWLRSRGSDDAHVLEVNTEGTVAAGGSLYSQSSSVRPALQLDLSRVTFDSETKTFTVVSEEQPTGTPGTHVHDGITFTAWDDDSSLPVQAGNYYLTTDVHDVSFSGEEWYMNGTDWYIESGTINLCLNGHSITDVYDAIIRNNGAVLNLYDNEGNGTITLDSMIGLDDGGTFNMYGGSISGKHVIIGDGTFNMYDGAITGCTENGVILNVSSSIFNMYGGTIEGNTGYGVKNGATFRMSGDATIEDNTASDVYLENGKKITVSGTLSGTDKIGVRMQTPGVFISSWNENMSGKLPGDFFTSGNTDYSVVLDGNNVKLTASSSVVPVSALSLKTETTLTLGDTETLTPTFTPENPSDKTVTWTSSDGTVATVANGVVTAVGPGTATITATALNGTSDTSDDKTATCTVVVNKLNPTANAPTASATYGQTLADVTLTNPEGNTPGTWAWVDGTQSVGDVISPAATFKANFTPTDTTNYNVVENVDVSVLVSKADPVYTVRQLSAFLGQTLADVALPTANNGTWSWEGDTTTTFNEIGTTTYFAKFTPNDTSNYNIVEDIEVQIQVTEKPLAVPATVTAKNRAYDGTEKPLVTVGNSTLVGGTMQYALGTKDAATEEYTTSIPKATDIGTYYVWYKVTGDQNHLDSEPACVTVTIKNGVQKAPAAPVVTKTTVNSITVKAVKGVEYSVDGKNWQTGGTFKSLKPGTKYTVRARKAAVTYYAASPVSKTAAKTLSYVNVLNAGLKVSASGKKINVKWGKVSGATAYDVYVQYCGNDYASKATATVMGNTAAITKVNGKAIDTGLNYKVYIVARNGKTVLGKSIELHGVAAGRMHSYTDPKAISVSKTAITLSEGKTASIGAKLTLVNSKLSQLSDAHATALRYVSSDTRIATVDKNGKITAKASGLCYIYVYARTGLTRTVTVTVK